MGVFALALRAPSNTPMARKCEFPLHTFAARFPPRLAAAHTFPAGNESVTVIDAKSTGQVTTQGVNVVGNYSMGPNTTLYGRMIIKGTITAPDLALLQAFANTLAGV